MRRILQYNIYYNVKNINKNKHTDSDNVQKCEYESK